jgi:hypothetical protein
LKFISGDLNNHLPVGDPFAKRSRRLIDVQTVCRLMQVQNRKDRQQITKKSFDRNDQQNDFALNLLAILKVGGYASLYHTSICCFVVFYI